MMIDYTTLITPEVQRSTHDSILAAEYEGNDSVVYEYERWTALWIDFHVTPANQDFIDWDYVQRYLEEYTARIEQEMGFN